MGTFFIFYFIVLPLLLGFLSHLWLIRHRKKRLKGLYTEPRPLPSSQHNSSYNLCIDAPISRQNRRRYEMDEKREEKKPMRRKISLQNIDAEEVAQQKQTQMRGTTTTTTTTTTTHQATSPPSSPLKKSSSTRSNCLCSPTTHVGSFRCRLHRHGGANTKLNMRRGYSVGSNLSDLANKFSSSNNPPLSTSTLQMSASSSQMQ